MLCNHASGHGNVAICQGLITQQQPPLGNVLYKLMQVADQFNTILHFSGHFNLYLTLDELQISDF